MLGAWTADAQTEHGDRARHSAIACEIKQKLGHRIMPSRFVLKATARWILLGHRDLDGLEVERFSPTPSGPTVHLAFQIISSMKYQLVIMDVNSAIGQSGVETRKQGPLFASMPASGVPGKETWMWLGGRTIILKEDGASCTSPAGLFRIDL